jgi:hypothetical protein
MLSNFIIKNKIIKTRSAKRKKIQRNGTALPNEENPVRQHLFTTSNEYHYNIYSQPVPDLATIINQKNQIKLAQTKRVRRVNKTSLLAEWCNTTTCHGVKDVYLARTYPAKILWTLVIIG